MATPEIIPPSRPSGGLPCPICRVNLVIAERQGIEIDYCPNCRGVWLDRGEIDKIIERSLAELQREEPARPSYRDRQDYRQPPYNEADRHRGSSHASKHGGGHGSFLKRLFD